MDFQRITSYDALAADLADLPDSTDKLDVVTAVLEANVRVRPAPLLRRTNNALTFRIDTAHFRTTARMARRGGLPSSGVSPRLHRTCSGNLGLKTRCSATLLLP